MQFCRIRLEWGLASGELGWWCEWNVLAVYFSGWAVSILVNSVLKFLFLFPSEPLSLSFVVVVLFGLFRAASLAYVSSQARG